jgi:uncharacterized lipoprotein YajG
MRKQWLGICIAASLLAACSSDDGQQQATVAPPQPAVCNGPIVEISGADPVYEPLNARRIRITSATAKATKLFRILPVSARRALPPFMMQNQAAT